MKRAIILTIVVLALGLLVWALEVSEAGPIGTAFTYQGRLIDANSAADGVYDFNFGLYDNASDGNQVGSDVNVPDVDVIDGYFTVALDFGISVFEGNARWLETGVRPGELGDPNGYTLLSPRREVTPTPYAMYAKRTGGDNDWMVSGNDMYSIPSGNVGVGESNPLAKLHVAGNVIVEGASPVLLSLSDLVGAGDVGVEFTTSLPGSKKWAMMRDGTSGGFLIQESFPYPPFLGGTLFMEAGTGNVGIGTKDPEKLLQIVNKEGGYDGLGITLDPHGGGFVGGTTWDIDNDDGAFKLTESRALPGYPKTRLTILEGNVGIGTTSPGAKLEVNGPIKITDGSQGAGKVLTSDASGLASWQNPATGTYYWSCVGANFHPRYNDTSNTDIDRDGAYIEAEADGIFFFAPVMLPHGARVTKVVVYGNATAEDWSFRRITLNSTTMNVVESAKIGTEVTLSTPHTIDNNANAYLLWTSSLDTGGIIYNARITYTQ